MDEGVHGWKPGGKITRGHPESRIAVGVFAGVANFSEALREVPEAGSKLSNLIFLLTLTSIIDDPFQFTVCRLCSKK